jgi:methyl-accepting chemotaxis protein-2 (aspartate sensor receptor)
MSNRFSRLSMGLKFAILSSSLLLLALGLLGVLIGMTVSRHLHDQAMKELTATARQAADLADVFESTLEAEVVRLAGQFEAQLPTPIALDERRTAKIGTTLTPVLLARGKPLNLDYTVVDAFTERTGAIATVFVRQGDEFIRISTTGKTETGARAVGFALDHAHPAWRPLVAGSSFRGAARVFGRDIVTTFRPLRDEHGKVVGAFCTSLEIAEDIAGFKRKLSEIRLRESGFFYLLDAHAGEGLGRALHHPRITGAYLLRYKDVAGHEIVREMLAQREGTLQYTGLALDGKGGAEERLVVFRYLPRLDWLVVGEVPAEEVFHVDHVLRAQLLGGGVVIALLLSLLLWFALQRMIVQRLDQAIAHARRVAAGDFSSRIRSPQADETGALLNALDDMADSLARLVANVRTAAESIHGAARQVRSGSLELSQRTEEQASSLEQTAASIEQLTGTVRQSSENAREANELARRATQVAGESGGMMAEVVSTMGEIRNSSKKIADIIAVIDGISFQSNILALNAAVEAARAGEQGRGFAVVAAEVRNLAQRSADSAREIKELILSSAGQVETGSKLVTRAGATMSDNVAAVQQVSELMSGIADASTQQAAGIHEVNRTIASMEQMTQQNAALVEEASASAEQLGHLADQLLAAVGVFKVAQQAGAPVGHAPAPAPAVPAPVGMAPRPAPAAPAVAAAQQTARAQPAGASTSFTLPDDEGDDWESF